MTKMTSLSKHERILIIVGLDKYSEDLTKEMIETPNESTIRYNTKKLKEIASIKERLQHY